MSTSNPADAVPGYFARMGLRNAEVFGKGKLLVPGRYRLRIQEIRIQPSRKTRGVDYLIATFKVVSAAGVACDGAGKARLTEGDTCNWIVNLSQNAAPGNVKAFLMSVFPDVDADSTDFDEAADAAIGPDQIAAEIEVEADAFLIQTSDGNDFTKVNWTPT